MLILTAPIGPSPRREAVQRSTEKEILVAHCHSDSSYEVPGIGQGEVDGMAEKHFTYLQRA